MADKKLLEALDRTLRDLCGESALMGGAFSEILQKVPKVYLI